MTTAAIAPNKIQAQPVDFFVPKENSTTDSCYTYPGTYSSGVSQKTIPSLDENNSISIQEASEILSIESQRPEYSTIIKSAESMGIIGDESASILKKLSKVSSEALPDNQDWLLTISDELAKLQYLLSKESKKINKEIHRTMTDNQVRASQEASNHIKSYLSTVFGITGAVAATLGGFSQIIKTEKLRSIVSPLKFLRIPFSENNAKFTKGVATFLSGSGQISTEIGKAASVNEQSKQSICNSEAEKQRAQRERVTPHEDSEEGSKSQKMRSDLEEKRREAMRTIQSKN